MSKALSHNKLRLATLATNWVSGAAAVFLNPHPFYLAIMVSMFGRQSLQHLVLPFLVIPSMGLVGCIVLSTMAARQALWFAPAIAAVPLAGAVAWQLYAWQQPYG